MPRTASPSSHQLTSAATLLPPPGPALMASFARNRHRPLAELRHFGLPLFFDRTWTQEQLAEHGSYQAVAAHNGLPSALTLERFAVHVHDLPPSA